MRAWDNFYLAFGGEPDSSAIKKIIFVLVSYAKYERFRLKPGDRVMYFLSIYEFV